MRRFPEVTWQVDHGLLYPTATMAKRAAEHLDRLKPDALHLSMGSNTFVEKSVSFAIRRRLPRLYPAAAPLIASAKALAGGRAEGNPGMLGLLFRAPRRLGRLVFGMASLIDPGDARKATIETFEMLSRRGIPVVVRLAEGNTQQAEQRESARILTREYNETVAGLVRALRVPRIPALRRAGAEVRAHGGRPARRQGDAGLRRFPGRRLHRCRVGAPRRRAPTDN